MLLRLTLILIVPFLSIVFALISSGIENTLTAGDKEWKTIPIIYWIVFWSISWYLLYRTKFGSIKSLKICVLRTIIKTREKYLGLNISEKDNGLNNIQKKAMHTWNKLLRDKNTNLISCVSTTRRMLVRDDTLCVISATNETNFLFTKNGSDMVYYDVWLPNGSIGEMFNSFDKEQKIRFQKLIDEARISALVGID